MKRIIEIHEKFVHFETKPFGSSLECYLLLDLLVDFRLEMHVNHNWTLSMIWTKTLAQALSVVEITSIII